MYYILVSTDIEILVVIFKTKLESKIGKLFIQTYFNGSRTVSILDEEQYIRKNFGNKTKYIVTDEWYKYIESLVKKEISGKL